MEQTTEHPIETTTRSGTSTVETTTVPTDDMMTESTESTDLPESTVQSSTTGMGAEVNITKGEINHFMQEGHMGLKDVEPGFDSTSGHPNAETLEIRNFGENPVNIDEYVLHYVNAARTYTFSQHTVPAAGGSVTIHSGTGETNGSTFYAGFDQSVLPDDPRDRGTLELIAPGNKIVFSQTYIIYESGEGLVIQQ